MRILSALILSLLLLTTACGSDTATPTATATTPAAAAPTEPADAPAAETEPAAPAEQSEAPPTEPSAAGSVVLEPQALGVADESGTTTSLAFGEAEQETTVSAVTSALGEPTSQQDALECGPGALDAVNWEGLTAFFQEGTLAGWYVQEPAPASLTSPEGIGLGSPLGDVRAAYGDVTVEETTIGFEFTAGDISGLLTADSDHDTVTTMWSGANCIAR